LYNILQIPLTIAWHPRHGRDRAVYDVCDLRFADMN